MFAEQNFFIALPLKPENWSVFMQSAIPCVSIYVRRNFIEDSSSWFCIFNDENFEYRSIATSKYIFFPLWSSSDRALSNCSSWPGCVSNGSGLVAFLRMTYLTFLPERVQFLHFSNVQNRHSCSKQTFKLLSVNISVQIAIWTSQGYCKVTAENKKFYITYYKILI